MQVFTAETEEIIYGVCDPDHVLYFKQFDISQASGVQEKVPI